MKGCVGRRWRRCWIAGFVVALGLMTALSASAGADEIDSPAERSASAVLERLPVNVSYRNAPLFVPARLTLNTDPSVFAVQSRHPLMGDQLLVDSRISYAVSDSPSVDQRRDTRPQVMRLSLHGQQGAWRYGVAYRMTGEAVAQPDHNKESRAVWLTWQAGSVSLTASVEQRIANLLRDPGSCLETTMQKRLGMHVRIPGGPLVSMSYLLTDTMPFMQAGVTVPHRVAQTVEGRLEYTFMGLTMYAQSQYETPDAASISGPLHQQHRLSGKFSPLTGIMMEPSFTLTEEKDRLTSQRTDIPTAQLAVGYQFPDHSQLQVNTVYSRTQRNLAPDQSSVCAKGLWTWPLNRLGFSASTLSVQTLYKTEAQAGFPAGSQDELAATFYLNVTSMSWGDTLLTPLWFVF